MKIKKIIIILLILITTGCFNYVEINNLVIVSGIGIDYKDNKYVVTFENLYQNKESSDSNFATGITKTATGDTIANAFDNITLSLEKNPYYAHLKVVIISSEIANNHLDELFDFFLRNNDIRNIFSLVISKDITPQEIFNSSSKYYPVVSERIKNLLENNIYSNYISKNKYFKNIASNYLSGEKNITLSSIYKKDDELILGNLFVFDSEKVVGSLNQEQALILSIIDNNKPSSIIKVPCKIYSDKKLVIRIYESKTKFSIKKNEYKITNNLSAEIIENSCNINLENKDSQKEITDNFEKEISNQTIDLINYLKIINSDILGINNKYFIKYRRKNSNYFKDKNFKVNTILNINKKGLIFEVKNDNE